MVAIDEATAARRRTDSPRHGLGDHSSTITAVQTAKPNVVSASPESARETEPQLGAANADTRFAHVPPAAARSDSTQESRCVGDFTNLSDGDFIREAYSYILDRETDDVARSYRDRLDRGYLTRIEVLHALIETPEAKKRGVRVRGLTLRYMLVAPFRVRYFGYGLRILSGLLRLPRHVRAIYANSRELSKAVARSEVLTAEIREMKAAIGATKATVEQLRHGMISTIDQRLAPIISKVGGIGLTSGQNTEAITALGLVLDQNAEVVTALQGRLADIDHLGATLDQNAQAVAILQDRLNRSDERLKNVDQLGATLEQHAQAAAIFQDRLNRSNERLKNVDQLGATLEGHAQAVATLHDQLGRVDKRVEAIDHLGITLDQQARGMASLQDRLAELDARLHDGAGPLALLYARVVQLEARRSAFDVDLAITEFRRRLLALEDMTASRPVADGKGAIRQSRAKKSILSGAVVPKDTFAFDLFYADFESRFRGTRADIKNRQHVYLDYLKASGGPSEKPIIDIGCGRGEWLQLLGEHGINAIGVDINELFIHDNERHGLTVVYRDGVEFLRSQPDESARAITGFHIIEHLDFSVLVELLDESLRVLAPGGIAIFETPNPENLITAAHMFYMDPTHRHPIPPLLAAYLLDHRGFANVEVIRLHADQNQDIGVESKFLQTLLLGPRDYGVLGRK